MMPKEKKQGAQKCLLQNYQFNISCIKNFFEGFIYAD